MMRPRNALFFLVSIAALAAAMDLTTRKFRRPIQLRPGPELARIKLDRDVYANSRADLADLRVVRDGDEIPYVLETIAEASDRRERLAEIVNQSVLPNVGLQLTLRLSPDVKHNSVRIQTPEHNFRQSVRVETSEDGRRWAIVRDGAAIFDFTQDNRQLSSLTVEYPVSTQPQVRLTIGGWTKVGAVSAAYVDYQEQRSAAREILAEPRPKISEDARSQSNTVLLDLGVSNLPVDRVHIETPAESFLRAVDVEASPNGNEWHYVRQSVIERWSGNQPVAFDIPETRDRYLRLRIYNRDDRPIGIIAIRLEGLIRHVKFFAAERGDYHLFFGQSDSRPPSYDLAAVLAHKTNGEPKLWPLGPIEPNPSYKPPAEPVKPWSERHPIVLYSVLIAAVLGLGVATFRFATRLRPPQAPPES